MPAFYLVTLLFSWIQADLTKRVEAGLHQGRIQIRLAALHGAQHCQNQLPRSIQGHACGHEMQPHFCEFGDRRMVGKL
jgi:hypothetical protein